MYVQFHKYSSNSVQEIINSTKSISEIDTKRSETETQKNYRGKCNFFQGEGGSGERKISLNSTAVKKEGVPNETHGGVVVTWENIVAESG